MAKITELPQGNGLAANDVFPYVDVGNNVTKKYPASALLSALASATTADIMGALMENTTPGERHRMFFGGRNLGTSVSAEQKTAIQNATFRGLLVGDYWNINGVNWRIVDMDYWYATGNWTNEQAFFTHHLVIMPDFPLVQAPMNDTNTTEGGYVGSKMYTDTLPTVKATCEAAFPGMVLTHPECLIDKVKSGMPTHWIWMDSTVDIPSEIMMYGSRIFSDPQPRTTEAAIAMALTTGRQQFALFNLVPRFGFVRQRTCWLRETVSDTTFATIDIYGNAFYGAASNAMVWVRPVFAIGVAS